MTGMVAGGNTSTADALLQLLSNPDAYRAEMDRLQSARQQAEEVLSKVGPAHDILALRAEESKKVEEASKALHEAGQRAAALLESAKNEAALLLESARRDADHMRSVAEAAVKAAQEEEQRARDSVASIETSRKAVEDAQAQLLTQDSALREREQALAQAEAEHKRCVDRFRVARRRFEQEIAG